MVILEALNALYGDCLLLRYPGPDGKESFLDHRWRTAGRHRRRRTNLGLAGCVAAAD